MRDIGLLGPMLAKVVGDLPVIKWCGAVLLGVVGYVFPTAAMQSAAATAFGFVLMDTVSAIAAVAVERRTLPEGEIETINSASMYRFFVKLTGYSISILTVSEAVRHVAGGAEAQSAAVTAALAMVLLTEATSIMENVRRMGIDFQSEALNDLIDARVKKARAKRKPRDTK